LADVSILTVALSASVSVFTGYIGTLMNYSRQRRRQRRTYGLSLLAEIKALETLARQYYGTFFSGEVDFETYRLPKLSFSNADMSVFSNVSGNVGLFSTRAAVEIINYYSTVRSLVAQAQTLNGLQEQGAPEAEYQQRLADHLRLLRAARRQNAQVVRTLRRETPTDLDEKLRICRRRSSLMLRRLRRRSRTAASTSRTPGPA
jgi:hypothetical protein